MRRRARHLVLLLALALVELAASSLLAQEAAKPLRRRKAVVETPAQPPKPTAPLPMQHEGSLVQFSEVMGALAFLSGLCQPGVTPNPWQKRMENFLEAEGENAGLRERMTGAYNQSFAEYATSYRQCTPAARAARTMLTRDAQRIARDIERRFGT